MGGLSLLFMAGQQNASKAAATSQTLDLSREKVDMSTDTYAYYMYIYMCMYLITLYVPGSTVPVINMHLQQFKTWEKKFKMIKSTTSFLKKYS